MRPYDPKTIEPKWQKIWEDTKLYQAKDDAKKPKCYALEFFPYPSGATLHVGHVRNYTINDAWARFQRMQGKNVLHPMGWDAFGLPAENYAIKNNITPRKSTDANIKVFKRQFQQMGFSYDWSREIDSSRPDYYKWTQWLFLLFYKKGLAYRKKALVNWCPQDQTVLANEQVVGEKNECERCGTPVVQKELEQWFLKITDYADRLLEDLDDLDWPQSIKTMQRNWIGKSQGALVEFGVEKSKEKIEVFTTRQDTQYGVTFMVLAPEHPLVSKITTADQKAEVDKYVTATAHKTQVDRMEGEKDKTGVFTGAYAINPINKEKVPIWIADYVLTTYGTGAVMGVPGHDQRDHEFATKYKLPICKVIETEGDSDFHAEGVIINSGKYNGLRSEVMREQILKDMVKLKVAKEQTNYRVRDWSIGRQRYWGAPIPMIHCKTDGMVPVPEKDLPVVLPENVKFTPTGRSPLLDITEFVNTKCPKCGQPAQRETDTMDAFVDSSWYFLRFADPHNDKEPFAKDKANYWLPVDMYVGGAEHAVMHLLYARFWTKVLYDAKHINFDEPFKALRNQGLIGGADGRKMGKRYNNSVTPDDIIKSGYGADALRAYELFIAPFDQGVPWDPQGIVGTRRFLDRVWTLVREYQRESKRKPAKADNGAEHEVRLEVLTHKTVKRITQDMESFSLNTAVSALMEMSNGFYKLKEELPFSASPNIWRQALETLIKLLAPIAPHITEELWHELGHKDSVHVQSWPVWDSKLLVEDVITVIVQVNGKVRANISLPADSSEEQMVTAAKADPAVSKHLDKKKLVKTITVPAKLVNFVVN